MSLPIVYGFQASPPVRAVLLTAKIVGIEVEFKTCDTSANEHLSEDYLKMNPAHTVPSFNDNGFVIWESRAVMTYLVDKYGHAAQHLYPKDLQKRAAVDNILHFDNGSLFPALKKAFRGPYLFCEFPAAGAAENFRDKLETLEKILGSRPYAAGDQLTLADISIISTLTFPIGCRFSFSPYPHINNWITKVVAEIPFYDDVNAEAIQLIRQKHDINWKTMQSRLY